MDKSKKIKNDEKKQRLAKALKENINRRKIKNGKAKNLAVSVEK